QVRHVEVVGDQVALRVALVRPEDLVEVRQPQFLAVDLEPPGVPVPAGVERLREPDGERGRRGSGPFALRWHAAMVATVKGCSRAKRNRRREWTGGARWN